MKIILYTDDMEPITFIDVPFNEHQLDMLRMATFRVAVAMPLTLVRIDQPIECTPLATVTIRREKLVRNGREHYFYFTDDEELALILQSEPLPGQRRAFQDEYRRGFAEGFVNALRLAI